ncbi:sugar phosphate isomerase/epimerase [Planctomycetota bacterium]|nr:sugar phosphate isomerase/epimerase [Planctomycetota bacterium]
MPSILSAFTDEASSSIDAQITAAQRANLTHLDLRSIDDYNITNLPPYVAKEIAAKLKAANLSVCMFGSPIGKIDINDDLNIDIEKLNHLADLAPILGTNKVRIFSYYNNANLPKDQWQAEAMHRLHQLSLVAEKRDMVLYHENESDIFGDHPDDIVTISSLRSDNFKLIYDFANFLRTSATPDESWSKLKSITDCFHLKDQKLDNQHTPIGLGDTNSPAILTEAITNGFTGPIIVEPHLTHSEAVLATHSTGTGDLSLASLPPAETFHIAVTTAQQLLTDAGCTIA